MAKERENKLLNWEILGSILLTNEQTLDASTVFDCTKDVNAYPMRPYFSRTHLRGKVFFSVRKQITFKTKYKYNEKLYKGSLAIRKRYCI